MKGPVARGLAIWATVVAVGLYSGCTKKKFQPTAPGPGVPRISNFRIEPPVVDRGGEVTLLFDFRDIDGDIIDVYLGLKREVADFTLATGLQYSIISHGRYLGQREGTAEETITVSIERRSPPLRSQTRGYEGGAVDPDKQREELGGTRVYEVFVIDRRGQVSNRLGARVTVR
ncbi:MAG: hypothetical protein ACE5JQ_11650 [Candidatus Methylomirabilales bacterium]